MPFVLELLFYLAVCWLALKELLFNVRGFQNQFPGLLFPPPPPPLEVVVEEVIPDSEDDDEDDCRGCTALESYNADLLDRIEHLQLEIEQLKEDRSARVAARQHPLSRTPTPPEPITTQTNPQPLQHANTARDILNVWRTRTLALSHIAMSTLRADYTAGNHIINAFARLNDPTTAPFAQSNAKLGEIVVVNPEIVFFGRSLEAIGNYVETVLARASAAERKMFLAAYYSVFEGKPFDQAYIDQLSYPPP